MADLIDRLRLDHAARARGALVVEGPTDASVLAEILGIDERQFFPVSGRVNVLRVSDALAAGELLGVICVADRDFDDAALVRSDQAWMVFTDSGDLEAMLVLSEALSRVLREWAVQAKVTHAGGAEAVRERSLSVVAPIAALRRANAIAGLGLCFDAVDVTQVVDRQSLELRIVGFLDRLAQASGTDRPALQILLEDTDAPMCPTSGAPLVRGRDVTGVIDVALTGVIGDLRQQQAKGLVSRCLRLAARPGDLDDLPFVMQVGAALDSITYNP